MQTILSSVTWGLACACAGCGSSSAALPDASGDATMSADAGSDGSNDATVKDSGDSAMDSPLLADTGSDGPKPDAGPGTYTAYYIPGGYDRVVVFKADPMRKLCFEVRLRYPDNVTSGLTLPSMWGLESAGIYDDDQACVKFYLGGATFVAATTQTGTIAMQGMPPTKLDIDVTMTWQGAPMWVPPSEKLATMALAVQ